VIRPPHEAFSPAAVPVRGYDEGGAAVAVSSGITAEYSDFAAVGGALFAGM